MTYHSKLLAIATCLSILFFSAPTFAIKKCQDENGKWHYGDVAVEDCDNTKVTTLNDRGFVTDELDAPKTDEELQAEQDVLALEEAERMRIKQEEDEKLRILSIYETEEDIDRQRDNQINSVAGNISVHEAYLKSMASRIERTEKQQTEVKSQRRKDAFQVEIDQATARVESAEKELASLKEQKINIMEKFKKEKEVYRALKNTN